MMRARPFSAVIVMVALLLAADVVRADTAAESFAKGEALLAKGEVAPALELFAAAARTDRNNPEYMQHYAMTRRILDLRNALPAEKDPQRWEYMARGLRAFYASERIYPELVKLDQELHSRLASAESAALLADTQLAMSRNADALATLTGLESGKATDKTQALLGIALARSGQKDRAKQIAEGLRLPDNATPSLKYAAARLYGSIGDAAKATAMLKACFESTLPSQLEGFKAHAKVCPEFAAMTSSAEFAGALETKSKVPESKCSGGGSCAGCPMKGKCPMSQGK